MSDPQPTAEPSDVQLVTVTPEIAREWLGYNTHNRRLRERTLNAYAEDMAAGDWKWNGESIKFGLDGALLDGQHRLAAIIKSDVTVPLLVVRGLPNSTQETMDTGTKRNFADVLQLRGEANCTLLASIVRKIAQWEAGDTQFHEAFTTAQLLQVLEKYPWIRQGMRLAHQTSTACRIPSSVVGLCWFLFMQLDTEDAEFFFARLEDGQNLSKEDAIYLLRRQSENRSLWHADRSHSVLTAITIKAWNHYRTNTPVAKLSFKRGGATPERFPEPQ